MIKCKSTVQYQYVMLKLYGYYNLKIHIFYIKEQTHTLQLIEG